MRARENEYIQDQREHAFRAFRKHAARALASSEPGEVVSTARGFDVSRQKARRLKKHELVNSSEAFLESRQQGLASLRALGLELGELAHREDL